MSKQMISYPLKPVFLNLPLIKKTACLEKKLYGLIKRIWPHQTQEICKAVFRNDLSCSKFSIT